MADRDRLTKLQTYGWTLELLGETLVDHDDALESDDSLGLSPRHVAGIHHAVRIIGRLVGEECTKLLEAERLDSSNENSALPHD